MQQLDGILREATRAIPDEYFVLPIYGAPAQYRERVYCYELYHQMRSRWPDPCVWFLNGEVDKGGNLLFEGEDAPKPDFLVHVPGHQRNFAAIEVKTMKTKAKGLRKDLGTLQRFRQRGYERAILLIYGTDPESARLKVLRCGAAPALLTGIELWVQLHVGIPAEPVPLEAEAH